MNKSASWALRKPSQLLPAALVGFGLMYALGSRAIDTGSWWQYSGTAFLAYVSFKLLWRGISGIKTR